MFKSICRYLLIVASLSLGVGIAPASATLTGTQGQTGCAITPDGYACDDVRCTGWTLTDSTSAYAHYHGYCTIYNYSETKTIYFGTTWPANSSTVNGVRVCNSGFHESNNTCVANPTAASLVSSLNASGADLQIAGTTTSSSVFCYGGYVITGTGGISVGIGGSYTNAIFAPFSSSGTACSSTAATPYCEGGTIGSMDGVPVCASTTAPVAGVTGSTAVAVTGAVNVDGVTGAVSSSASTSCVGGSCTSSTTYKDGAGATVGTRSTTATLTDYCATNPSAAMCKSALAKTIMDESGTPSGSADSVLAPAQTVLNSKFAEVQGLVEHPVLPSTTGWNFTTSVFGIPSASCSPLVWASRLGTLSIDVCTNPLVNTMRSMLAWMMYVLTVLYIWRSANSAVKGN